MTTALVTGGGGFLGSGFVRAAIERGWSVRSFSRGAYPQLAAAGVDCRRGDIADADAVSQAVAGVDVVFHTAAKVDMWGRRSDFERSNVEGTDHVIAACRRHGVRRLVFTSSPSVVHDRDDLEGVDESAPYPDDYDADYPRTKAEAERRVLAADGDELTTVALRPHLIWGPGDTHVVPQIVERARAGRLRLIDGGRKLVDTVFVDNAVDAHLLAAELLRPGAPCAGRAYFITNGEPKPLAEIVNRMLAAAGEPPVTRSVPRGLALSVAGLIESAYRVLPLRGEPPMTRFIAHSLATAHWYDISAAERDLDYRPRVSLDEGFERLAEWYASQRGRP